MSEYTYQYTMYEIDEANRQIASLNLKVDRLSKELLDAALLHLADEQSIRNLERANVRNKERTLSRLQGKREGPDRQSFDGVPERE